MAASFFILAGQLSEAIKICCKQLNDPLLAVLIARVCEGENGTSFPKLLEEKLLPEAASLNDFWMESICHWWLHRYQDSLDVLLAKLNDKTPIYTPHISTFYDLLSSKPQLRLASNHNSNFAIDRLKLWSKSAVLRKISGDPTLALEDVMRVLLFLEQDSSRVVNPADLSLITGRLEELRLELVLVDVLERCKKEELDGSEIPYIRYLLQKYNPSSSLVETRLLSFLHKNSTLSSVISILPSERSSKVILSWLKKCITYSLAPFLSPLHKTRSKRSFISLRSFHKRALYILQSDPTAIPKETHLYLSLVPLLFLFALASVEGCIRVQKIICCESLSTLIKDYQSLSECPYLIMDKVYQNVYTHLSEHFSGVGANDGMEERSVDHLLGHKTENLVDESIAPQLTLSLSAVDHATSFQKRFTSHLAMKFLLVNMSTVIKQQHFDSMFQPDVDSQRIDLSLARMVGHIDDNSIPETTLTEDAAVLWTHIMQNATINATCEGLQHHHDQSRQVTKGEFHLSDKVELGWFSPQTKGFVVNRVDPTQIALVLNERVYHYNTDCLPLYTTQASGVETEAHSTSFDTPSTLRRTSGSIGQNLNQMFESVFGSEKAVPLSSKNILDDEGFDEFIPTDLSHSALKARQASVLKSESLASSSAWRDQLSEETTVDFSRQSEAVRGMDSSILSQFKRVYHEHAKSFSETTATWIESHPLDSCLLSGDQFGDIQLWEYGQDRPIFTFASKSKATIKTIHFSEDGCRFGAINSDSALHMWNFQATVAAIFPYHFLSVNKLNDFSFIGSSSLLATCGQTQQRHHLQVWDLAMPSKFSFATAATLPSGSATGIGYNTQRQVSVVVSDDGHIYPWDIRAKKIGNAVSGHHTSVKFVSVHPKYDYFATTCQSGSTKLWDLRTFQPVSVLNRPLESRSASPSAVCQTVSQPVMFANDLIYWISSDGLFWEQKLLQN